jgi:hypothetical protein
MVKDNPARLTPTRTNCGTGAVVAVPLQTPAAEGRRLERCVADLVTAVYGLTPEEVALMWKTAPPRIPGEGPGL